LSNMHTCRRLINDLLTATNPDGSLKYPKGLFTHEIKAELDSSWGWGDIGAALNAGPLADGVVVMGIYAVQPNGYAAKRWTAITKDNPYLTQSMRESLKTAQSQIRKLVNNRMRPAITAVMYAQGDADDIPAALGFLDDALTDIKRAVSAGDERAKRLKAERAAKTATADLKAAEAKLAEVQAELEAIKAGVTTP